MSVDDSNQEGGGKKADEILQILKKGTEFTHELLKENEKLRFRLASLEEENKAIKNVAAGENADSEMQKLYQKLAVLEEERTKLIEKYKAVENENQDFATRYVEIENENNILANLYVASYQLHSTLDFNEVLRIILEIIINLVGSEQFAVLLLDEKTQELSAVATEGMEKEEIPVAVMGEGTVGEAARSGEVYINDNPPHDVDTANPLVCIPMRIKERTIGIIVIYKLLQQKSEFTKLDYELFTLLAGHTATAIFSAKLYSESERKLSTMQGFINLLTAK